MRYAPVVSVVLFLFVVSMLSSEVFACGINSACPRPSPGSHSGHGLAGGQSILVVHNVVIVSVVVISQATDTIPIAHVVMQVFPSTNSPNSFEAGSPNSLGLGLYGLIVSVVGMTAAAGYTYCCVLLTTMTSLGSGTQPGEEGETGLSRAFNQR